MRNPIKILWLAAGFLSAGLGLVGAGQAILLGLSALQVLVFLVILAALRGILH